jgi:renalase
MAEYACDVLVIGAGIAGLTAARALHRQGANVAVLEKSRGYGGRAASRTVQGTRIDHGAQFVTAREPRFRAEVEAWLEDGTLRHWTTGIPTWTRAGGWREAAGEAHPRYACPSGMNALGKALAAGLDVTRAVLIAGVRADAGGWLAETSAGRSWHARHLILSPPLPQTLALVGTVDLPSALMTRLSSVDYAPCHAVVAGFEGVTPPVWAAVRLPEEPDLALIAHDASKRDASAAPVTLVLHGTPAFTRRTFEWSAEAVMAALLAAATPLLPWATTPAWTHHHRWRYARPEWTLDGEALEVCDGLTLCGDAFGGGRLEGAYLSGLAAAQCVVNAGFPGAHGSTSGHGGKHPTEPHGR